MRATNTTGRHDVAERTAVLSGSATQLPLKPTRVFSAIAVDNPHTLVEFPSPPNGDTPQFVKQSVWALMARWMGVADGDLEGIFPDLANFGRSWDDRLTIFFLKYRLRIAA